MTDLEKSGALALGIVGLVRLGILLLVLGIFLWLVWLFFGLGIALFAGVIGALSLYGKSTTRR